MSVDPEGKSAGAKDKEAYRRTRWRCKSLRCCESGTSSTVEMRWSGLAGSIVGEALLRAFLTYVVFSVRPSVRSLVLAFVKEVLMLTIW